MGRLRVALAIALVLMLAPAADAAIIFKGRFAAVEDEGGLKYPYDVEIDAAGDIYVVDTAAFQILKYDHRGRYLMTIGTPGTDASHLGDGQLYYPNSIALDPTDSFLYVADTYSSRIQVFSTTDGAFVRKWGSQGSADDQMDHPRGIDVDAQGNVYIADAGNRRVMKFTSTGTFIKKWGQSGTGDGEFIVPMGIAVDDQAGRVYVTDENRGNFQEFTLDGAFVDEHGFGTPGPGEPATGYVLFNPDEFEIDPVAAIAYVIEAGGNGNGDGQEVSVFDLSKPGEGSFVADFYGTDQSGSGYGFSPHGIGYSRDTGDLIVAAGSAEGKLMFRYKTPATPTLTIEPKKNVSQVVNRKKLQFDVSHNMMVGSCNVKATGEIRTPLNDPLFDGEVFKINGPRAVVQTKRILNYSIPLSDREAKAIDKTRVVVDLTFKSPDGCNQGIDQPQPEKVRFSL